MNENDLRAYYKANAVRGDARFALENGEGKPLDLLQAWSDLHTDVIRERVTSAHTRRRDTLRTAVRLYLDGRPYAHLLATVSSNGNGNGHRVKKTRRCPHCGEPL